jgi:hypothetical protein
MSIKPIKLDHIPDIAWIIALWKAIHGGDPAERDVAVAIGEEVVRFLGGKAGTAVEVSKLENGFKAIGLSMTVSEGTEAKAGAATTEPLAIRQGTQVITICFGIPPNRKCVPVTVPKRGGGTSTS